MVALDLQGILVAAATLILIIVAFYGQVKDKRPKQCSRIRAPEPSGAWPLIGHLHLLRGKAPVARILGAMADKYGPVFSLKLGSRPALVVSSWEMIKECFATNDVNFASRPSMAITKYLGHNSAMFALAPYGQYWRDVRKMVTLELLTSHRLEALKKFRDAEYNNWFKDLYLFCAKNNNATAAPTKVMLGDWFELLTENLIIKTLAGKRFSTSGGGSENGSAEDKRLKQAMKRALYLSGVFVYSDVIPFIEWLDIGGHIKDMKEAGKDLDEILGGWLEEHIQKRKSLKHGEGEADLMDEMLSTLPEDTLISGHKRDAIIKSTATLFILTATESTSETLIWGLSLLLNNPKHLKLALEELDNQVGKNRLVEEADIKNLKYLQAIVKETLRLYPPGPLGGPREAIEDCYVGKYFVPKGTRLIVNLWRLHRDPRIWNDALDFKPERFLDSSHVNTSLKGRDFEFIPFSSGRRMCPAVQYALQVIQLTFARVLQGFDLTTPMGLPVDMEEGLGIALPKVKPLEVLLTPRLPVELYQNL